MRIQIGYKFILGFVLVVASVAFSPEVVRRLGYSEEITKVLAYVVALTIGLILGWIFSRTFTRNISLLTESAEFISRGDLPRNAVIGASRFPDETCDIGCSINRMVESLRGVCECLIVGGGIHDLAGARRVLGAGADAVAIGTAAMKQPALCGRIQRELRQES